MTPEEAKEIIAKSDRRFKNLVKAIENYNIHIDVICHDYIPSSSEVAKSHSLTTSCNPKEIAFAYIKDNPAQELLDMVDAIVETDDHSTRKEVHGNNKKQQSYGSFVSSFLLSVKNSVKRKI